MSLLRENTESLSWLIPGIGAQGGDLETSVKIGNKRGLGIINVSRSIIYAAIRKSCLQANMFPLKRII